MKVLHDTAAPTGAAQAECAFDFYQQEIAAGRLMGIVLRCGEDNAQQQEVPISLELGARIATLLLEYTLEQLRINKTKLADLTSRAALSGQKGGVGS